MSSYDVIVIGSGAGGGTLVRRLAGSGKRILLLERGDWLAREPQNWQSHDVATKDIDFALGNIQMVGKSQAEMYRGEKPIQTRLAPEWTLRDVANHAVDFWLSTEDLPRPDNRVTLREDGSIRLRYTPSNDVPKQRLLHELKSMLKHLGMHHDHLLPRHAYLKNEIPVAGCAHQAGTCRFGTDPATSVLDTTCRAHEVDNLYVVDTSFFPSIGAVNPALTAMANALRVGDHLLERLGASAPSTERTHVA